MIGFGVALLHSLVSGRRGLGVSVYDDLDVVLINSVVASLASNVLRYWLIRVGLSRGRVPS